MARAHLGPTLARPSWAQLGSGPGPRLGPKHPMTLVESDDSGRHHDKTRAHNQHIRHASQCDRQETHVQYVYLCELFLYVLGFGFYFQVL